MGSVHRSATEVVRAAVAALEAERWQDVAVLVQPAALQRHRDTQLHWMLQSEERKPRTSEDLRAEQPWLSPEAAASFAEQERRHLSGSLPALRAQWGVASFRELEALSPAEFFVRYLAASTPAAQFHAALAASHTPPRDAANALHAAPARHWTVLGEVLEGTRTAHVVYRESAGEGGPDEEAGSVRVTTLDHQEGRWWLRIDPLLLPQPGWSVVWAPDAAGPGGANPSSGPAVFS